MEWVGHILVLFDVHFVVLDEDDSALIVVLAAVVWRAEDCDNRWESLMSTPSMHLITINLDLMRPNHRDEIVCPQDLLDGFKTELDGAFALRVRTESHFARVTVVHRVRPK